MHSALADAESSWAPSNQSIAVASQQEISSIIDADTSSALRFLAACSAVSSKWASSVQASLERRKRWDVLNVLRWLPVLRVLLQFGDAISRMDPTLIEALAGAAMSSGGEGAGELIVATAKSSPHVRQRFADALSKASDDFSAGGYNHITGVVARLAQLDPVIFGGVAVTMVEAALRWQVSVLSDVSNLGGDSKSSIVATSE